MYNWFHLCLISLEKKIKLCNIKSILATLDEFFYQQVGAFPTEANLAECLQFRIYVRLKEMLVFLLNQ